MTELTYLTYLTDLTYLTYLTDLFYLTYLTDLTDLKIAERLIKIAAKQCLRLLMMLDFDA